MKRQCSSCYYDRGEKVPAVPGHELCSDCLSSQAERAHEAIVARCFGGFGPRLEDERAWQQKAEFRR